MGLKENKDRFPDFLGIGAQRSGSSWLYTNLRSHPEIWLTPIKELHYFNRLDLCGLGVVERFADERVRRKLRTRTRSCLAHPSKMNPLWDMRYFLRTRNDAWYASLFHGSGDRIAGEITPAYSTLDGEAVKYIRSVIPTCKLIYVMRNPIERSWSHAKMDFRRQAKRTMESVSESEFIEHFNSRASRLRGDYLRTLNNWEAHFPREQMFIAFFDEILDEPHELLMRIFEFLGVTASRDCLTGTAQKQINRGSEFKTPGRLLDHLVEMYIDPIERLSERFGGYASRWMESARKVSRSG